MAFPIRSHSQMGMGSSAPGPGASPDDSKAAVANMQPDAVHRLVQDALSGKFGPEAQRTAQKAMQSGGPQMPSDGDGDEGMPVNQDSGDSAGTTGASSIFGSSQGQMPPDDGADDEDGDEQAQGPTMAKKIFGRR